MRRYYRYYLVLYESTRVLVGGTVNGSYYSRVLVGGTFKQIKLLKVQENGTFLELPQEGADLEGEGEKLCGEKGTDPLQENIETFCSPVPGPSSLVRTVAGRRLINKSAEYVEFSSLRFCYVYLTGLLKACVFDEICLL